jgi:purine-binding chemotaxis protein CheW
MNQLRQYCSLTVGDLVLGIGVGEIQEVIKGSSITPVPLAHPAIRGLINLRGQIVTAIDLRRRLGLEPMDADREATVMVLGSADEAMALVVDSVGDVVEVDISSFETPPETLRGEARRMIEGAYKLERSLMLILDLFAVLDLTRDGRGPT